MRHLPTPDQSLDLIICLEGIEHVTVDIGKELIREVARVLSADGKIIMTNPLPDPNRPSNPYHVHEYESEELEVKVAPFFRKEFSEVFDISGVSIFYYVGKLYKS